MTQDKALSAVNGCSLNKGCHAGLSHFWASLRARREAVICCVASLGNCSMRCSTSPIHGVVAANGFSPR